MESRTLLESDADLGDVLREMARRGWMDVFVVNGVDIG